MQSFLNGLQDLRKKTSEAFQKIEDKIIESQLKDHLTIEQQYYQQEQERKLNEKLQLIQLEAEFTPIVEQKLMDINENTNIKICELFLDAKKNQKVVPNLQTINILNCLAENKVIDMTKLRQIAFLGLNDEIRGLRSIVWRILLFQLPADTQTWDQVLKTQYDNYEQLKAEIITKSRIELQQREVKPEKVEKTKYGNIKVVKNQEKLLWDKIEKDVKRT